MGQLGKSARRAPSRVNKRSKHVRNDSQPDTQLLLCTHPVSLLSGVGSKSQRIRPSSGIESYTRLTESQMSGRLREAGGVACAGSLSAGGIHEGVQDLGKWSDCIRGLAEHEFPPTPSRVGRGAVAVGHKLEAQRQLGGGQLVGAPHRAAVLVACNHQVRQ